MFIQVKNEAIRFTGRWDIKENAATTITPSGMIEIAYWGKAAVLHFNMEMYMQPYPHLWISVDHGVKMETVVDHVLRIEAPEEGNHVIRVIFKSAVPIQHRWYPPLMGKICFEGVEAEGPGKLPEDTRKIIEFIGDSITEGCMIDAMYQYEQYDEFNRPVQDDSTATYAYLTATNLHMKPIIMGYGSVGVSVSGCGSVPKASEAYLYNFAGSPAKPQNPELIVINHGANDNWRPADVYVNEYKNLLKVVRHVNPQAKIIVLSAFLGVYPKELEQMVKDFNEEYHDQIYFIDSAGWIPREPIHPLRDGHAKIAEHLTREIQKLFA